jgi:uncharacterized protein YqeY
MPTVLERIETDYKSALKAGQRVRVDTYRLVKAAVQRAAMDKRKDQLDDAEVLQVISQQVKQRKETLEAVKSSGRQDVLTQTSEELAILTSYLPQQLSPEAITQLIDEAIKEVGLNQGAIMKQVMAKAAGAADGKTVSGLVGERLKAGK